MGLSIQGDVANNDLQISRKFLDECNGVLVLHGTGAIVRIDEPLMVHSMYCTISSDARIIIGPNCVLGNMAIHALAPGAAILIGRDVGFNGQVSIAAHEKATIDIGDEALFASGVEVNASDVHQIFDLNTNERINPAKDITIGRHVWLGAGVMVMKGTRIGEMSVVGAGSVVNTEYPANSVIAGRPGRVVRDGIYWRR